MYLSGLVLFAYDVDSLMSVEIMTVHLRYCKICWKPKSISKNQKNVDWCNRIGVKWAVVRRPM